MPPRAGGSRLGPLLGLCLALLAVASWADDGDPPPRSGMLLLATAQLQHPLWRETVILLLEHGPRGTLGVIVNRPLPIPLEKLLPAVPGVRERELAVYLGGPVAREELLFLLRAEAPPEGAREVVPGVFFGPGEALLDARVFAATELSELRVFTGRAGWAPGQLEAELARGDWRVLPADAASVFELDGAEQWRELMQRRLQRWVGA
ncbi:MAG TPA: YqgE/AlgH family protein [Gammaproteobacteria bacterium]